MPVHRQAARKKGRLTVTAEQPCGVQVVEWVDLVYLLLIRGKPDGSIIGIPEGEG